MVHSKRTLSCIYHIYYLTCTIYYHLYHHRTVEVSVILSCSDRVHAENLVFVNFLKKKFSLVYSMNLSLQLDK